jgi:hypothetical protein
MLEGAEILASKASAFVPAQNNFLSTLKSLKMCELNFVLQSKLFKVSCAPHYGIIKQLHLLQQHALHQFY